MNIERIKIEHMQCTQRNRDVRLPQQIGAFWATDLISQIVLQVTFWQYRVKLVVVGEPGYVC